MPTTHSKPTPAELDQAKRLYNDVNYYLDYLTEMIQSEVQELQDDDDEEDEDDDELELSPTVFQFLNDYKEYKTSQSQIHAQLLDSDNPSTSASTISSRLRKRLWRYSQTLSPDILCEQKSCETKLDCSVRVSPLFSTSLPSINSENEKLLTNEASPSVALLKAQLNKDAEKNCIVIRQPRYPNPIAEEKRLVFVVKKSPAAIIAPPTTVEPIKEEIEDEKYEVFSEKKPKKNIDFLASFLAITKVGFSRSNPSQLIWT